MLLKHSIHSLKTKSVIFFVKFGLTTVTKYIIFRFLEIYTAKTTYSTPAIVTKIYKYLIPREYFVTVRTIIDSRVPPVMSKTVRPPTPVAGEILRMVLSPVSVAYSSQVLSYFISFTVCPRSLVQL